MAIAFDAPVAFDSPLYTFDGVALAVAFAIIKAVTS